MVGAMQAVTVLGQGIGSSVVQAKILVGGLWGWYFGEMKDSQLRPWMLSALCAICGILWLSAERRLAAATAAAANVVATTNTNATVIGH